MARLGDNRTWTTGEVALDSATTVTPFRPMRPVRIVRVGYVVTTAETASEDLDINFNYHPTIGSATGALLAYTIAGIASEAIGAGRYTAIPDATNYPDGAGSVLLDADEELEIDIDNAMTAGDGDIFVEYQELPFVANGEANIGSNLVDIDA
jgi:hypothetical protein